MILQVHDELVFDVHQDEVDLYMQVAEQKGIKIAYVIDTHVHADHYTSGSFAASRPLQRRQADTDHHTHHAGYCGR